MLVACSSTPRVVIPGDPSLTGCAGEGRVLIARALKFDRSCLSAPIGTRLKLRFDNQDAGVDHNVDILPAPFGYNRPPPSLFFGEIITGRRTVTYHLPALPAGEHFLVCYVHHDVMYASVRVPPSVQEVNSTLRVDWVGIATVPTGFVFDVQVREGSGAWRTWLRGVGGGSAPYRIKKGETPSFRVSLYRAGFTPLSYSPSVSAVA